MANKKRVGLLIAMALAAPAAVNAQGFFDNPPGFDDRFYITPFGSYTWGQSNSDHQFLPAAGSACWHCP